MNNQTIRLSQYYLAYIDILGIKEAIKSDKSEEYLNNIKELYELTYSYIKVNCPQEYFLKANIKIFSDNLVIAVQKKECYEFGTPNEIASCYLMIFASFFQVLALKYSLLVRGSIIVDDLYIDETFIYGKALSEAYKLESEIANYPRIIINPRDIHLFMKSDFQQKIISKDSSNIYYINPFECYFTYVPKEHKLDNLNVITEILTEKLSENNDNKINQKVCWFINMFNDFCSSNGYLDNIINLDNYPYSEQKIEVRVTGFARELIKKED